ncbi:MAG: hypothetical protein IE921_11415 [Rhodobacteraceae bacterium]|nr:hypothetical protein [Paracoccaceae bacterium]
MSDPALAIAPAISPADEFDITPQDRRPPLTLARIAGMALSLLVIGASLYQVRELDFAEVRAMIPSSPLFWILFVVSYLAGPASEWIIFRRLWNVGPGAFAALVRKLIYNEMLVGYLGEVYFYGWARRTLTLAATPFGAVKDVAVLSALAGNVMTLVFLAVAFPLVRILPLQDHATAIGWSLAFVVLTSIAVMMWRGAIFSLDRAELRFVLWMHIARILATTALSALLWHLVLPEVALAWWLVLATIRLLISRLPFVPNKDVVFAGVAVLALGQDVQLASLMTMMAALILVTHVVIGLSFAIADLFQGGQVAPSDR